MKAQRRERRGPSALSRGGSSLMPSAPSLRSNKTETPGGDFSAEIQRRVRNTCVQPRTVTINVNYETVFRAIDEHIWAMMKFRPQVFNFRSSSLEPRVRINYYRAYLFTAFQYYMYNIGCMADVYDLTTSAATFAIPLGLAKVFQQFAPFVDTSTGSTYTYLARRYVPIINTSYYSVDINGPSGVRTVQPTSKPWDDLNIPLERYLITTGNIGVYNTPEAATFACLQLSLGYAGSYVSVLDIYEQDNFILMTRIIPSLTSTILIKDIPRYAPDGSAYAYTSVVGNFSLFPDFDVSMTHLLGQYISSSDLTDSQEAFPYSRPLPVYGVVQPTPSYIYYTPDQTEGIVFSTRRKTLLQVYFTIVNYSEKWSDGMWQLLMKHATMFAGVERISYKRAVMGTEVIARQILDVFRTGEWTTASLDDNNKMAAFVFMAWNAIYQRNFEWLGIKHDNPFEYNNTGNFQGIPLTGLWYLWNSPCFCSYSSNISSFRFPPALATAINSMGPIMVDNEIIFPQTADDQTINNSYFASSTRQNLNFYDAYSTKWQVDQVIYGMNVSNQVSGGVPLVFPGTTTLMQIPPVTNPAGYIGKYNVSMSAMSTLWMSYQNLFPSNMGGDRWITCSEDRMGSVACVLSNVATTSIDSGVVLYKNSQFSDTFAYSVQSVASNLCLTNRDVFYVATFSIYKNNRSLATNPMYVEMMATYSSPLTKVQQDFNNVSTSQFRQYIQAMKTDESNPESAAVEILQDNMEGYREEVNLDASPSYTSMQSWAEWINSNDTARYLKDQAYQWSKAYTIHFVGRQFFNMLPDTAHEWFRARARARNQL